MTSTYTDSTRAGEFLLSEGPVDFSREQITLAITTVAIPAGTVLTCGLTATARIKPTNTGNGTCTLDATTPLLTGAMPGVYSLICITAASNAGTFRMFDPRGAFVVDVAVGVASANQLKLVIADGAVDFIVGDAFFVTVEPSTYAPRDPKVATQNACAILYAPADISTATQKATAIVRHAEVASDLLVWHADDTAASKAVALAQLAQSQIIARN